MKPGTPAGTRVRYTPAFCAKVGAKPREGVLVGRHPTIEAWAHVAWDDTSGGCGYVSWVAITKARG